MTSIIKNFTYLYAFLIALIFFQAPAMASAELLSVDAIRSVGHNFISFLNKAGQSDIPLAFESDITPLFTPDCKKIVNNKLLVTSSEEHLNQLRLARAAAGKWTIMQMSCMISSSEERSCTLRFEWQAEKIDNPHTTMVILSINNDKKITCIDEVFCPCEKTVG
ncbi:MAG: hypothetical protein K2X98_06335 [Alphaproteobacteria bacterium]|nr:hypothetical protein [Alphaproteobacteria bacterium]